MCNDIEVIKESLGESFNIKQRLMVLDVIIRNRKEVIRGLSLQYKMVERVEWNMEVSRWADLSYGWQIILLVLKE